MREQGKTARIVLALSLLALGCCLAPASALAAAEHPFLETFGSAQQPSFEKPQALAVDQANGDLYVADVGLNEVQSVKVSATAGKFKLVFEGKSTLNIPFDASAELVQSELRTAIGGTNNVRVSGGPGDATGSTPYTVTFQSGLGTTDVPQLECLNGTLSGGSGCTVTTTTPGVNSKVRRFKPDGTPDDFSALSSNALDNQVFTGQPEGVQIAVDNSAGGKAKGDVYVTVPAKRLFNVYASSGTLLDQLSESSEGILGEACGVAVDEAGALYLDAFGDGVVHKYIPSANPPVKGDNTENFTSLVGTSSPCTLAAGAGLSAGAIFVDRKNGELFKLDSSSGELKYQIASGVTTVSVDPESGHLYAAIGSEVVEYDASGTSATVVSKIAKAGTVTGIALDGASGNLYVAREGSVQIEVYGPIPVLPDVVSEAPTEVTPTEATLHGAVNPNGAALKPDPSEGCFFEWGETESYGEVAPCEEPDAEEVGEGTSPVAVHAKISGLRGGATYHYRLLAANQLGFAEGEDEKFLTLGPSIENESASQITASAAKINGEVNPRGKETSFEVQYVPEAQWKVSGYEEAQSAPVPAREVGSGTEFKKVTQQLLELAPATTYHFRLVADSEVASSEGLDGTFKTFAQPQIFPDERAYEMVSPVEKAGGEVFPPLPVKNLDGTCVDCLPGISSPMMPMQSAPDGEAVAFEGQPFSGGLAAGPNQYVAGRGAGGWESQSLSSSLFANGRGTGQGYEALSSDLSRAVIYQISPALSPQAPSLGEESYPNLYLRDAAGNLTPLVAEAPPDREPLTSGNGFKILYDAANAGTSAAPALSHVVFEANDALTAATVNAPAAIDGGVVEKEGRPINLNLYEWVGGQLRLVNVLPNETTAPGAVLGSGRLLGSNPSREAVAVDHAISADGSRIFWSRESDGQLFVRIDGEETREIGDHEGKFITASADGSKVLLSDGCLYSLEAEECEDLTLDQASVHQGGFKGILGGAEDLSRVYFVDTAILTEEPRESCLEELTPEELEEEEATEEGRCRAKAGEDNLYAWDEGTTSFVAALSKEDNRLGAGNPYGDWKASRSQRTAQVSADGRFVAFMSEAELSGYDNVLKEGANCLSGSPVCQEVFEYDGNAGSLRCASCNPSGQRPLGGANLSLLKGSPLFPPLRQPANLSAEGGGRLFFESRDPLSTRDANGAIQDVYEWEPDGVGSCRQAGGCVSLISTGQSPNDSMFVDSTPSGNDVFLITREQLLPRDKDQLLDLYDARVGGGFPEGEVPPCGGEACRGPISGPPSQPSAGSPSFIGPGNPPRKHHKKEHHHKHKRQKRHHKRGGRG